MDLEDTKELAIKFLGQLIDMFNSRALIKNCESHLHQAPSNCFKSNKDAEDVTHLQPKSKFQSVLHAAFIKFLKVPNFFNYTFFA